MKNKQVGCFLVSMLTFTWLTKPAQLAPGDPHLLSDNDLNWDLDRSLIYKSATSYFTALLFPTSCSFPATIFSLILPGFREGAHGGQSLLPPVLLLSKTQHLLFWLSLYSESSGFGVSRAMPV